MIGDISALNLLFLGISAFNVAWGVKLLYWRIAHSEDKEAPQYAFMGAVNLSVGFFLLIAVLWKAGDLVL